MEVFVLQSINLNSLYKCITLIQYWSSCSIENSWNSINKQNITLLPWKS